MKKDSSALILAVVAIVAVAALVLSLSNESLTGWITRGGIKVSVRACAPGLADCDGSVFTVCESDLNTNNLHCGACGNACGTGESCSAGVCIAGGPITCALRPGACGSGEVFVWSVSDPVEGHVSLSGSFGNSNCCVTTAGTLLATCGTTVLRGSSSDDAHAQSPFGLPAFSPSANYCISSSLGTVNCRYVSLCAANEGCVGSLSDINDGHFGPCGSFATKVCCKVN